MNGTITLTIGEQSENHRGMQINGQGLASNGYTRNELLQAKQYFENKGCKTKLIKLHKYTDQDTPKAWVLKIKKASQIILNDISKSSIDLFNEHANLPWDKKAKMYGRIVNKRARWNLCYSQESQAPDYANGKGTIISFDDVPLLKYIYDKLPSIFGSNASNLEVEGNYYYDISECGIGFHGDSERKKVIAIRLGQNTPLYYQWFKNNKSVGNKIKIKLKHSDIYMMSEKATGFDWKKSSIYTLRHATGCDKFTTIKSPN